MTEPCLPGLFDQGAAPARKKRGHVPASSVEAYQRTHADTRVSYCLFWLERSAAPPTSAELATQAPYLGLSDDFDLPCFRSFDQFLLYVRRGLSDAKAHGLVEHGPSRVCAVSQQKAMTWLVKSR